MKLIEKQQEELLAPHEEIGSDSMPIYDLKIQLFYYQKVFDMAHNRPKILALV